MEEIIQNLQDRITALEKQLIEIGSNQPPRIRKKITTGDFASGVTGDIQINEFDNTLKYYAEGAWRSAFTW